MKVTNEKVYRCDFCNKAMVSKGFMVVHEKMCKQNPENQHKCFQYCKYLQKDKEFIGGYGDDDPEYHRTKFICLAKDIELKSYKVKRNKNLFEYNKDIEFMPLECDKYEAEQGHDFSDIVEDFWKLSI